MFAALIMINLPLPKITDVRRVPGTPFASGTHYCGPPPMACPPAEWRTRLLFSCRTLTQGTADYMEHLEMLTMGCKRVLLIAGQRDAEVITMYS